MSTWQVVKNDLQQTVQFSEAAALTSSQLMVAAESAHTTFQRITPHLSSNPEISGCIAKMNEIFQLAHQAHKLAFECFHAVDDANRSFT